MKYSTKRHLVRNILKTITLAFLLTGCIIPDYDGLHHIVNENVATYQNQPEVSFLNVAAIFKTYSHKTNKNYNNFNELENETEKFLKNIKTSYISNNYPIKASKEDVKITSIFLHDVLHYIKSNETPPSQFKFIISQSLKLYTAELIYYEDKKPK